MATFEINETFLIEIRDLVKKEDNILIKRKLGQAHYADLGEIIEAVSIDEATYLVKVLGSGTINSPVKVEAHKFSKSAVEAIEKAGGETKII